MGWGSISERDPLYGFALAGPGVGRRVEPAPRWSVGLWAAGACFVVVLVCKVEESLDAGGPSGLVPGTHLIGLPSALRM